MAEGLASAKVLRQGMPGVQGSASSSGWNSGRVRESRKYDTLGGGGWSDHTGSIGCGGKLGTFSV